MGDIPTIPSVNAVIYYKYSMVPAVAVYSSLVSYFLSGLSTTSSREGHPIRTHDDLEFTQQVSPSSNSFTIEIHTDWVGINSLNWGSQRATS